MFIEHWFDTGVIHNTQRKQCVSFFYSRICAGGLTVHHQDLEDYEKALYFYQSVKTRDRLTVGTENV